MKQFINAFAGFYSLFNQQMQFALSLSKLLMQLAIKSMYLIFSKTLGQLLIYSRMWQLYFRHFSLGYLFEASK